MIRKEVDGRAPREKIPGWVDGAKNDLDVEKKRVWVP